MWLGNLFIGKGTLSASFLSRDSVPKILSQPKMAALIEYSICIPQRKPKKAIEFLACPKWRPRPINGSGHFRELSDVTTRHLAWLWNFRTLRPKINPCPTAQPRPCHALERSCRNTKKTIEGLKCPERWPRPINGNGHFRERCDVTKRHLARLWNFGTLRPKINPCPIDQPHPCHALPHSWRITKKQSNVLSVPNGGPAP